jgi:hypothetical protein
MDILGRRRTWLAALAVLAAFTFLVTSVASDIVHHHSSPSSEASCPICHLSHRVAVRAVPARSVPLPRQLSRKILPHQTLARLNPLYSQNPTRAPPSI